MNKISLDRQFDQNYFEANHCHALPYNDLYIEDLDDEMDAGMGFGIGIDYLDKLYFIPVSLHIVIVCSVIYILIFFLLH